jgi:DNA polymerase III psi subunit
MILPSIALGGSSGWLLKDDDISHLAMATQAKAWNLRQAAIALEHKQLIAMRDLLGRILRLKQSVALDKWRTAVQNALDKKKKTAAKSSSLTRIVSRVVNRPASRRLRQRRAAVSVVALKEPHGAECGIS